MDLSTYCSMPLIYRSLINSHQVSLKCLLRIISIEYSLFNITISLYRIIRNSKSVFGLLGLGKTNDIAIFIRNYQGLKPSALRLKLMLIVPFLNYSTRRPVAALNSLHMCLLLQTRGYPPSSDRFSQMSRVCFV